MNHSFATVLGDREYRKYAAAAVLAFVGGGMQFIAMSWYLYRMTGQASSVGLVFIFTALPGLLLSPWIGALVDRSDPRRLCVAADVLRGLSLLCLVAAMTAGLSSPAVIYASSFFISLCDNFYQPAVGALVRDVVGRDRLLAANIVGNMSMQIGLLSGAGIGGWLVARYGAAAVIAGNVVSYLVSAALTAWIRVAHARPAADAQAAKRSFWDEFRDTVRYVRRYPQLAWLGLLQMFVYTTVYACNTLLPAFVDRELQAGPQGFGVIDAAWGVGAIVGGLALTRIVHAMDRRVFGLAGLLAIAFGLLVLLTARGVPQAFAAYAMLGFLTCSVRINTDTILVSEVSQQFFGKVKAMISMFIAYMSLMVYAVVGWLGDQVSVRQVYAGLAVAVFAGFVLAALPRVGLRRAPAAEEAS